MKIFNHDFYRLGVLLAWMLLLPSPVAADIPHGKGVLFLVERDGLAPSYIFGTIHSEDKRVLQLPSAVRNAFDAADTVALEMTMDEGNLMAASLGMLYLDGRDLPGVIGKQRYKRVVAAMAGRNVPEEMLRSYKPWSVATILSMPKAETGMFLDMVLYTDAINRKKKVIGLESAAEQISIFDDLSDDLQIAMLDDTLEHLEQLPSMFKQLMDAYLARDMAALVKTSEKFMQQGDPKVEKVFQQRLLDDRNHTMVERLQPLLQKGRLFVAVGALHLPGEQGILQQLEDMDYRVTAVY
jgi:uncharacterized protein YbaP (TraB family)